MIGPVRVLRSTPSVRDSAANPRRLAGRFGGRSLLFGLLALGVMLRLASSYPYRSAASGSLQAMPLVAAHLAGLISAGLLYTLMLRWGVWRGLAAIAVLPILFDLRVVRTETEQAPSVWIVLLGSAAVAACFWRALPVRRDLSAAALCLLAVAAAGAVTGMDSKSRAPHDLLFEHAALAEALRWWADVGRMPSLLLLTAVGLALSAAIGLGRARPSAMRTLCIVTTLLPVAASLGARTDFLEATSLHAALAWWPAAGALGLTALVRGRRGSDASLPQVDAIDREAHQVFDERYAKPRLAPVVAVIAAYNEGSGLPGVLAGMPQTVCDLPLDVLVVDDGSTDDTATALDRDPRAYAVSCRANRGQGAALRLGYLVAREHGAAYILTTDADGQYDTGDFPRVLSPLLDGRADFVSGSRRLGQQYTYDRVRRLGVHVFAWLVSVLVGQRLTDTSFGLRAMRADVTAAVTLNQPQYQSSELLIGTISHGFTVLEVPGTMHRRAAGATKKGRNLVYGRRYAGVVLSTWWREGCPRPVAETAPALRGTCGPAAA